MRGSALLRELPDAATTTDAGSDGTGADGSESHAGALREIAALDPARRPAALRALVSTAVAAVLGHDTQDPAASGALGDETAFKDMGFDSLTAVALRDRLNRATALTLPTTVVFDHPSITALAACIEERAFGRPEEPGRDAATAHDTGDTNDVHADDPIAIVSMGCRFPGGVRSPEDLWRLVSEEVDAITPLPADRGWDLDALYDADPDHLGTSYVRESGFLEGPGEFDAGFFGISARRRWRWTRSSGCSRRRHWRHSNAPAWIARRCEDIPTASTSASPTRRTATRACAPPPVTTRATGPRPKLRPVWRRAYCVRAGAGGSGGDGRHGLLVLAGSAAPGRARPA
ncbi:hypothetical protein SALBM217S_04920 [Streptomyces griseoloalbus]